MPRAPAKKTTKSAPPPPKRKLTRGERVIAFIERYCVVPEGDLIGKKVKLDPFQLDFIRDVYDNPHLTHTAILSLAKKNGKTLLIACILLAHLCGPEARRNSQIVSGAQSKEQAAVVFELAKKMVELSEELSSLVRISPSGKRLIGLTRNVLYRALAAEGKTAHGISPILVILDEVGQVSGPTDPFVSALTTAQGAYSDALLIVISTQAATDADLLSVWIDAQIAAPDPRVVLHLHTAPEDCELDDESAWRAANPALGTFRSIADMRKLANSALSIPSKEPEFRNLNLNQRVEAVAPFVSKSIWEQNASPPAPIGKRKVYAGLDLSAVSDLTSFTAVTEDHDVHCTFWLPADGLLEKARADRVPYDLWVKQGLLTTSPGKAIEYEYIAKFLRKFFNEHDVAKCAFDRYNFRFLKPWLLKEGFSEEELAEKFVEYGQGTASMTPALRELEVKLTNGQMKHGANPILTMCARNVRVVGDSGARKFDKKISRGRIDGMVTLAMAVGVMPVAASEEAPPREPQLFFV